MSKKQTAEYKNQFARKNYDRLEIRIKKGDKEKIQAVAEKSINSFVTEAIKEKYKRDTGLDL